MNILNGNEAFAAMCAGKNIECRFIESSDDFDDIRNFSATVFIDIAFEFRIAITYITIGEMQVPEPIRISPEKGATCSYPSPNTELGVQQFKWNGSKHQLRLLKHGQVHLSLDHATTHCAAIILVSGGDVAEDITQLMKKEDINYAKQAVDVKVNSSSIKKTDTSVTIADVEPSGVESEDTPWEVDTTPKPKTKHAFTVDDVEVIEEDPLKIVEKFTAQINACATTDSALKLRHSFAANGHLDDTHVHHLMKLVEDKCLELDPEQYAPKIEIISQENVTTSEDSLIDEIDSQATKAVQDKIYKDAISDNAPSSYPIDMLYSKKKQMLINRIYDMDSVEALERLAPAIPAAKLKPEDHQELLSIYAERKTAMMHVDGVAS